MTALLQSRRRISNARHTAILSICLLNEEQDLAMARSLSGGHAKTARKPWTNDWWSPRLAIQENTNNPTMCCNAIVNQEITAHLFIPCSIVKRVGGLPTLLNAELCNVLLQPTPNFFAKKQSFPWNFVHESIEHLVLLQIINYLNAPRLHNRWQAKKLKFIKIIPLQTQSSGTHNCIKY